MSSNPEEFEPVDADDILSDVSFEGEAAAQSSDASGQSSTPVELELQQTKERLLRTQAEVENVRRRLQRDAQGSLKFASQSLLTDLLPVLDNIERAIEAASQTPDSSGLLEGVKMVQKELMASLEKHHCKRVPAAGQVFDPALHEAIAQMPSPDVESGHVMIVNQQGYQLHDRVIRPAQVVVSSGPPAENG